MVFAGFAPFGGWNERRLFVVFRRRERGKRERMKEMKEERKRKKERKKGEGREKVIAGHGAMCVPLPPVLSRYTACKSKRTSYVLIKAATGKKEKKEEREKERKKKEKEKGKKRKKEREKEKERKKEGKKSRPITIALCLHSVCAAHFSSLQYRARNFHFRCMFSCQQGRKKRFKQLQSGSLIRNFQGDKCCDKPKS